MLIGTWENTDHKDSLLHTEKWSRTNDSLLVGFGLLTRNNDTLFQEKLSIQKIDGFWYYIADTDENPMPVHFKINTQTDDGFEAVNPVHDFPKYINYRITKDSLHALVSDGENKKIEFDFFRRK